jgi:phage tail-like protein
VKVGGNTAVAELVTIEHEGFERESVVDIHFKFHVTIEGVQVGAFSDASGLSAEGNEITEQRSNERKLGGLPKYPNIVLKRGYTQDRSLWNWYRNTIAGQSDDRRRVTITLMNEALQPVQRWHAEHAWVTKYDPTSLDADPNNIAVDTIEIAHEGITIEPDDKV